MPYIASSIFTCKLFGKTSPRFQPNAPLTSGKLLSEFCADGLLSFAEPMKTAMPAITTPTTRMIPIMLAKNVVLPLLGFGAVATGGINRDVSSWQCGHERVCPTISTGKEMCPLQCWQLHLASLLIIFPVSEIKKPRFCGLNASGSFYCDFGTHDVGDDVW